MSQFISCRPFNPSVSNPMPFANFQTRTMVADLTGDQINTVFPLFTRVATIDFQTNVGLSGITLSSSIINEQPGTVVGVFVGLDRGQVISSVGGFEIFVSHIGLQNSTPGARQASSRSNAISMGDASSYRMNSGQKLALYACSFNNAGNELAAMATAYFNPV